MQTSQCCGENSIKGRLGLVLRRLWKERLIAYLIKTKIVLPRRLRSPTRVWSRNARRCVRILNMPEDSYIQQHISSCQGGELTLHRSIWPGKHVFKAKNTCRKCGALWCNTCRKHLNATRVFGIFKVESCESCGGHLGTSEGSFRMP